MQVYAVKKHANGSDRWRRVARHVVACAHGARARVDRAACAFVRHRAAQRRAGKRRWRVTLERYAICFCQVASEDAPPLMLMRPTCSVPIRQRGDDVLPILHMPACDDRYARRGRNPRLRVHRCNRRDDAETPHRPLARRLRISQGRPKSRNVRACNGLERRRAAQEGVSRHLPMLHVAVTLPCAIYPNDNPSARRLRQRRGGKGQQRQGGSARRWPRQHELSQGARWHQQHRCKIVARRLKSR